jgi:Holliday junction resolvase RusA-like endonuclease
MTTINYSAALPVLDGWIPVLAFRVEGVAQTRGSKVPIRRGAHLGVRDSNPKSGAWMSHVSQCAAEAKGWDGVLDCPLLLRVTFYRVRPKGHYGKRGLKPTAPEYPTTKPDAGKLLRGVEDALTGVVYRDDSLLVDSWARKRFGDAAYTVVEVFRTQ